MKLKRLPQDFVVEELTELPASGGPFALYLLEKRSLTTFDAIHELARAWRIKPQRIAYGGLKDRHAVTSQFLTIHHGPTCSLDRGPLKVTYQGQAPRPMSPSEIVANRFAIVIRELADQQAAVARAALQDVARHGLPNYFDNQRFGSLGESGQFIAQAWCRGDYQQALWLALAEPHADDKADEREQKRLLRQHWGQWSQCKAALARSHRRSIVTYLADKPADFRGAWARVRVELRRMYLAAFQSAIWNKLLALWLKQQCGAEQLFDVPLQLGAVPFFRQLSPEQYATFAAAALPLPSARLHLPPGQLCDLVQQAAAAFGMTVRELRVKYPRDSFFSKGNRAAVAFAEHLRHELADDDLYPGRKALTLHFVLPRGAYATILVKRILHGC